MKTIRTHKISSPFGGKDIEIHYIVYRFDDSGSEFIAAFAVTENLELIGSDGDLYLYDMALSFVKNLREYENPIKSWKEIFGNAPFAYTCVIQAQAAAKYYAMYFDEDCKELRRIVKHISKAQLNKGGEL